MPPCSCQTLWCLSAASAAAMEGMEVRTSCLPLTHNCDALLQSAPNDAPVHPSLPQLQSLEALAHEAAASPEVRFLHRRARGLPRTVCRCSHLEVGTDAGQWPTYGASPGSRSPTCISHPSWYFSRDGSVRISVLIRSAVCRCSGCDLCHPWQRLCRPEAGAGGRERAAPPGGYGDDHGAVALLQTADHAAVLEF